MCDGKTAGVRLSLGDSATTTEQITHVNPTQHGKKIKTRLLTVICRSTTGDGCLWVPVNVWVKYLVGSP